MIQHRSMDGDYKLLRTRLVADTLFVEWPNAHLGVCNFDDDLLIDFQRLEQHVRGPVILDFAQIENIDDSFFTSIMYLSRVLQARSIDLTVRLSPSILELARMCHFDRFFRATSGE